MLELERFLPYRLSVLSNRISQAIARITEFAGLCYTQLTDVEQEVNGLLTYDRKMKFDAKAVRAINDLVR